MIIAIDGPAASGKGTLAKRLAAHLRPAASRHRPALSRRRPRHARRGPRLSTTRTGGAGRRAARGRAISTSRGCAAAPWARRPRSSPPSRRCARRCSTCSAASPHQRGGAVLDGRDIGTVICARRRRQAVRHRLAGEARQPPPSRARAARRRRRRSRRSSPTSAGRDARDAAGADAPLKPAPDAVVLDTTALDAEAAFEAALAIVKRRASRA